jgi:cyanate permease
MRLWLKDSERRTDPAPIKTDDRKVVLIGLVLWLVALGGLLVFLAPLLADGRGWWLWTVLIGLGIGLMLLVYTHRRRHQR